MVLMSQAPLSKGSHKTCEQTFVTIVCYTICYLYVLNDLGIKGVIVRVGWYFCRTILKQIFLPGQRNIKVAVFAETVLDTQHKNGLYSILCFVLTTDAFLTSLSRGDQCAPCVQ